MGRCGSLKELWETLRFTYVRAASGFLLCMRHHTLAGAAAALCCEDGGNRKQNKFNRHMKKNVVISKEKGNNEHISIEK